MIIKDHINMPAFGGINPLICVNDERLGERFFDMSNAYDNQIISLAKDCAKQLNMQKLIREGVYVMTSGPIFLGEAEGRFLNLLKGNKGEELGTVGMSTANEVIVARHCGIKVLALSVVTDVNTE